MPTPKLSYRYCFVPECKNATKNAPQKEFFCVTNDTKRKQLWFRIARRSDKNSEEKIFYCCEDHFDLEQDLENYMEYRLTGNNRPLKKDVVPHIFACQPRRGNVVPAKKSRLAFQKRHQAEVNDILTTESTATHPPSWNDTEVIQKKMPLRGSPHQSASKNRFFYCCFNR